MRKAIPTQIDKRGPLLLVGATAHTLTLKVHCYS
jgi:hypothetical protein